MEIPNIIIILIVIEITKDLLKVRDLLLMFLEVDNIELIVF